MPDPFEQLWADVPEFNPFARREAGPCSEAQPFAQWCARLIAVVTEDPSPERFLLAKAKVYDAYCRWQAKTTAEHRAETNLDNHPCFHQLMLGVWHELENLDLCQPVRELVPPPPQIIESQAVVRDEPLEPSGVVVGYGDAE